VVEKASREGAKETVTNSRPDFAFFAASRENIRKW